jgi:murein DD-endopeptidase MepM/ murein hydrolase activator NlpD
VKPGLSVRAALSVAVFGCWLAGCGGASPVETETPKPISVEPIDAYLAPVRTEVRPGDTIESVCRRLAGDDWVRWKDALVGELDPRHLLPGTSFEGTLQTSGELQDLRVELDRRSEIQLAAEADEIRVNRVDRPVESRVERLEGVITSSLFGAVETAGGRPELAVNLAEVFQWDVDFFRDLRTDDSFVAVVDRQCVDDEFYRYGTLFAARFVNAGRKLEAVAYPDANGRIGYYDLEGRPLQKQFLRTPLKFSRITSRFSMGRFHPVLKRRMPHYGIDYGAPVGTPVHVTADGVVSHTGTREGAGRMVSVRHPNGYETHYLHLSRYGKGIRRGARVGQGQVVGYVGSSGLSTGPHLDYRVQQNGRWVNPLGITSPPAEPLDASRLRRFLAHALAVLELLEGREPPIGARC